MTEQSRLSYNYIVIARRITHLSSPNSERLSLLHDSKDSKKASSLRTTFIPFPPPPMTGFSKHGNKLFAHACSFKDIGSWLSSSLKPGTTLTPASIINCRAFAFEPIAFIAEAGGPTNVTPAPCNFSANVAFSLKNPYPYRMKQKKCQTVLMMY